MSPSKTKYVGSKLNLRRTRQGRSGDTTRGSVAALGFVLFFLFSPAALDKDAERRQTYYATYVSSSSATEIERRSCSPLRGESVSN